MCPERNKYHRKNIHKRLKWSYITIQCGLMCHGILFGTFKGSHSWNIFFAHSMRKNFLSREPFRVFQNFIYFLKYSRNETLNKKMPIGNLTFQTVTFHSEWFSLVPRLSKSSCAPFFATNIFASREKTWKKVGPIGVLFNDSLNHYGASLQLH